MNVASIDSKISDSELESLSLAILTKYGCDFSDYEKTSFRRRIQRIMSKNGMHSVLDLWRKLLFDYAFFHQMKDEISVGMTEMFRNIDFWKKFSQDILPSLADKSQLDIWHAGCATGEEVYSTAILLHEQNLLRKSFALATDLSGKFIEQATSGHFDEETFRSSEMKYNELKSNVIGLGKYVENVSKGVVFKDYLREYATFLQQNLVSDNVYKEKFDIAFCRNVMIYFNDALKMKVVKKMHASLKPGGLFFIGYYDSMPAGYEHYFDYFDSGTKMFVKKQFTQ